jgi:SAM-dependent methyltransferase
MGRIEDRGFKHQMSKPDYSATHPVSLQTIQCLFASKNIQLFNPRNLLDVGSYIDWVIGMSAFANVTMLDIREPKIELSSLKFIKGDAKKMPIGDGAFDMVTSLCTLEHVGTKAFGDDLDPDADIKMADEVWRVLSENGIFIVTIPVTDKQPLFMENCQRIYNMNQIGELATRFEVLGEGILGKSPTKWYPVDAINHDKSMEWDFYCGIWGKK